MKDFAILPCSMFRRKDLASGGPKTQDPRPSPLADPKTQDPVAPLAPRPKTQDPCYELMLTYLGTLYNDLRRPTYRA